MKVRILLLLAICVSCPFQNTAYAQPAPHWIKLPAPQVYWTSIACSDNGMNVVASSQDGIYVSHNTGQTWRLTSAPHTYWSDVASSAKGDTLIAVSSFAGTYVSKNFGTTWTQIIAPSNPLSESNIFSVSCSADGKTLIAVSRMSLFVSTNTDNSWMQVDFDSGLESPGLLSDGWSCATISSDGSTLVAGTFQDGVFVSHDFGNSWTKTDSLTNDWFAVASSADGQRIFASSPQNGESPFFPPIDPPLPTLIASGDSGFDWTTLEAPPTYSIAASADGEKLVALMGINSYFPDFPALICTSTDGGVSWQQENLPAEFWLCVACSADGRRMPAISGSASIYSSIRNPETPPARSRRNH